MIRIFCLRPPGPAGGARLTGRAPTRRLVLAPALLVLALLWAPPRCLAAEAVDAPPPTVFAPEFSLELDAYYTSASMSLPLTGTPVPNLGDMSEADIYRYLMVRSLLPRFASLEASVYPMPALGVYLKSNHPSTYENADIGADVNLIESLTAGFREPYALSLFFGTLGDFVQPGETRKGGNRAYVGYLVSYGNRHIKDNELIPDDWWEFEWKLKGDRDFENEKLNWSFRLGTRVHAHPEIADTLYLGLRRSNVDYKGAVLSWMKNSSVTFMSEFSADNGHFLRQEVIFGKTYPLESLHVALALDFGGIWQAGDSYSGTLADEAVDNFIFVFRPNIVF